MSCRCCQRYRSRGRLGAFQGSWVARYRCLTRLEWHSANEGLSAFCQSYAATQTASQLPHLKGCYCCGFQRHVSRWLHQSLMSWPLYLVRDSTRNSYLSLWLLSRLPKLLNSSSSVDSIQYWHHAWSFSFLVCLTHHEPVRSCLKTPLSCYCISLRLTSP